METTEEKTETKSPFEFSVQWHLQHAQNWMQIFEHHKPKRALEIGCYEGMSSVFLLDHAKWLKELVCLDSWSGELDYTTVDHSVIEGRFDRNIAAHAKSGIVKKMKGDSSDSLAKLIAEGRNGQFDFIYVDGNHTAQGTLQDAVMAWKLLAKDGLMIFDDYLWRATPQHHTVASPKIAIDAFTNIYSHELMILPIFTLSQVYCQKVDIGGWLEKYKEVHPDKTPLITG